MYESYEGVHGSGLDIHPNNALCLFYQPSRKSPCKEQTLGTGTIGLTIKIKIAIINENRWELR
jgi:hypothetical protein